MQGGLIKISNLVLVLVLVLALAYILVNFIDKWVKV